MTALPDHTPVPLSPGAARFSATLQARADRVTVSRATLMEAFTAALPGTASGRHARTALSTLLNELAEYQILSLPSDPARWDVGRPALPDRVRMNAVTPTKTNTARRQISWRPELDWAHSVRLTAAQTEDLSAINRWFRDTSHRPEERKPISLRERSHEIFKDEKRLDTLISGALFAPERLSLDQLATYREPPPLTYRQLGNGDTLLVAENSDTFATLRSLLTPSPGNIGSIAFGSGRAFEASVENIRELPAISHINYYGDLDAEGLAIPARASIAATQRGLPPIEPATELYRLLLGRDATPGECIGDHRANTLVEWLPPDLRPSAHGILTTGRRIAQEATNRNLLGSESRWRL
ncbi:Wadjet anti-phage system protein JetD domain-containing protein [Streptomyces sp. NPDC048383]|uniref:Wadjet anti-phage system protein JetD domain-containing protein n=1 Tax=Streptomyces sp. NPDC048383 TaxID=3155386 RepID=UPI0034132F2F